MSEACDIQEKADEEIIEQYIQPAIASACVSIVIVVVSLGRTGEPEYRFEGLGVDMYGNVYTNATTTDAWVIRFILAPTENVLSVEFNAQRKPVVVSSNAPPANGSCFPDTAHDSAFRVWMSAWSNSEAFVRHQRPGIWAINYSLNLKIVPAQAPSVPILCSLDPKIINR